MAEELKPLVPLICCDIPSVYSNKQSYYECLCYIGYKVNECINAINGFTDAYKDYTNQEIAKLKEYIDTLNNDMKEYLDGQVGNLNEKIDENYTNLDGKIDTVKQELQDNINTLTNLVYELNSRVYNYIETEINKLYKYIDKYACNNMKCLNPTNGLYESICKILSDIWDKLRYCGITCQQFDDALLTCDGFESLNFDCTEFDLYAGCILHKSPRFYMHNPFTGDYVFYQNVIYELYNLHRNNPITAQEYDNLQLKAEVYDSKEITSFNYDDNAKNLLVA